MAQRLAQHLIAATLALIVFLTSLPFIESVMRYSEESGPAIRWDSVKVLTPVVRPGDMLKVEYTRQHITQCPADIRRFIMLPGEQEEIFVRFPVIPGGARRAEPDTKTVKYEIQIPFTHDDGDPWQAGPHIFRMTAVRFCKHNIEYDTNIPDVHFTMEVK